MKRSERRLHSSERLCSALVTGHKGSKVKSLPLGKVFTLLERGPVVLVATAYGAERNVMTVSWTTVTDFGGCFAMAIGPQTHSFKALSASKECVVAIPPVAMLDTVIGIGACSGANIDKFAKFGLAVRDADQVRAPLLGGCVANLECRVEEIIAPHNLVVVRTVAAHVTDSWKSQPMLHAIGDGTFYTEAVRIDRRAAMHGLPESTSD